MGRLPKQIKVTGNIAVPDKRCIGLALRLSMMSYEGNVLQFAQTVYSPGQPPNFRLSIQNPNTAYLVLDVLSRDKTDQITDCFAQINNLSMSQGTSHIKSS